LDVHFNFYKFLLNKGNGGNLQYSSSVLFNPIVFLAGYQCQLVLFSFGVDLAEYSVLQLFSFGSIYSEYNYTRYS